MKKILLTILCMLLTVAAFSQKNKRPDSYNYNRAMEALNNKNDQEALDYLNKDIADNPKNGYAFSWIAMLRLKNEEYGKALTASDLAIKYLPKKDTEYVIFAYSTRASVYLCLEDTVKAINDYTTGIKMKSDQTDLYEKRAQIYFEQKNYDLSDADYKKIVEINSGNVMGYLGLGRNALRMNKYDDAIAQFNYAIKLDDNYSKSYAFRAEAELMKEMWDEATSDLVSSMKCEWDQKAVMEMLELKEPAFTTMISKLKIQSAKMSNDFTWPYLAGLMYHKNKYKKDYKRAIDYYKEANKRDSSPATYSRISECYYELGDYDNALFNINQSINMDSTDLSYFASKADIYYEMGNIKSAIAEWDKVLSAQPEYYYGYYRRGWYKELSGDLDGAVEDLSMSIVLEPRYAYTYVTRGDIYRKQGKKELAEADFKKVIEIEDTPENYYCSHYAYQGLGQNEKAIEVMDTIIARNEDRAGSYYDAACLYSRMKNKDKAIEYLEKSLENGYNRFAHIERDYDMDFIRECKEYKALIKKYSDKDKKAGGNVPIGVFKVVEPDQVSISEVPFTKENGVCKVKCSVNGLPLHFIFDTGASDVTISMVEATFMMKNGYLSGNDVVGSQRYIDANGDVTVGTVINLKNVNFGGMNLDNVKASVVRNQKAPLLLGQSVLGRLGKIEIDNSNSLLKISHNNY